VILGVCFTPEAIPVVSVTVYLSLPAGPLYHSMKSMVPANVFNDVTQIIFSPAFTSCVQTIICRTHSEVAQVTLFYACGGGGSGEPLACAATCAHDVVVALPPLKLAVFSGVVLTPTEPLTTVMSLWILYIPFAVSWICWRISLIVGCWSTLPMSVMMDAIHSCTMFHGI
jgi:hypothetical protein